MLDRWDGVVVLGLGLLGVGLWMRAPWLSLTVVGVLVVAFGVAAARGDEAAPPDEQRGG